ncbi:lipopolysaccharide heptosyltransferase II [Methylomonas sp. MgM2]
MVMAQSLFIALKSKHPQCTIDVMAPAWSLPLLQRMPEVSLAIPIPYARGKLALFGRIGMGRDLRANRYDQAILLPNTWKSALVPFFANIPLRTGYVGEMRWGLLNDVRTLDKKRLPMTVQRFVALANDKDDNTAPSYSVPGLKIDPDLQRAAVNKFSLKGEGKVLALCPGAEYGPAKRWPVEHFASVARAMHQKGWRVWLFGSDKDKAVTEQINRLTDGICSDLAGHTSLAEAVDALSLADAVVSNDSGLMHVAAALDKKVVAIYGSSDPGFTPPLHKLAQVISLNLECSPCFERECPLGHTRCLTDIAPERVLAALNF